MQDNERLRNYDLVGTSRLRKEWHVKNPIGGSIRAEKIRIEEDKAQHEGLRCSDGVTTIIEWSAFQE